MDAILIAAGGAATTGIPSSTTTGAVDEGVGGVADGGGGVPVRIGVGVGTGVGSGVGIAVGPRVGVAVVVATALADGVGVAGWLPHPAIKAAASVKAPSERRISPPTSAVAQRLRTS